MILSIKVRLTLIKVQYLSLFILVVQTRKQRKVNLERLRMKERRDAQHSRYRHLYQIRRSNGDVIARVSSTYQVPY